MAVYELIVMSVLSSLCFCGETTARSVNASFGLSESQSTTPVLSPLCKLIVNRLHLLDRQIDNTNYYNTKQRLATCSEVYQEVAWLYFQGELQKCELVSTVSDLVGSVFHQVVIGCPRPPPLTSKHNRKWRIDKERDSVAAAAASSDQRPPRALIGLHASLPLNNAPGHWSFPGHWSWTKLAATLINETLISIFITSFITSKF